MDKIVIPGTPIAKARPRFFRRGKYIGTYSGQKTDEGKAMLAIQQQWDRPPLDCPLYIRIICNFPRPKVHYGTGRNADKLKPSAPHYCTNSKDVDNLAKFYLDCMNELVFQDDKQVIRLVCEKAWARQGSVEIELYPLEE